MTEAERQRAEDELELIQIQRERLRLQGAQMDLDEAPSEMSGMDIARGAVQSFNKGNLLGFGDEIAGAGRALLPDSSYDFGDDVSSEEQSLGDQYKMYRDDEREVTQNFEDDYAGTAFLLNAAGSITNPINRVAPGIGTTGKALPRVVQAVGRGMAEGAAQGFGEGEGTAAEQYDSAMTGAKWGGGISAGLSGIGGGVGRVISKRREGIEDLVSIDPNTGEEIFKPITLADNSTKRTLGRGYAEVVGGGSGGGHKLGLQEKPFLDDAADVVELADMRDKTLQNMEALTRTRDKKAAARAITRRKEKYIDERTVDVPEAPARIPGEKFDPRVQPETQQGLQALARQSLPSSQVDDVLADITDPQEMGGALNKYWGSSGDAFREVKDRAFKLPGNIRSQLQGLDAPSKLELGNVIDEAARKKAKASGIDLFDLQDVLDEETGDVIKTIRVPWGPERILDEMLSGEIDGEVLMAIRNSYATAANKAGGMKGGAQRAVAQKLDALIKKQLGPGSEALAKFDADLAAYPNYITYAKGTGTDAADFAGGKATPQELFNAGKKQARKNPETGVKERPLGNTLRRLQGDIDARKAADGAPAGPKDPAIGLARANNKKVKSRAGRKADVRKAKQVVTDKVADIRLKESQDLRRKSGPLGRAKARATELAERATQQGRSVLSRRLTDTMIGSIAPGQRGMGANMLGGIAAAAGAAKPGAQLAVAGQTGWQKALAKALEEGNTALVTQILSRFGAGQATGE